MAVNSTVQSLRQIFKFMSKGPGFDTVLNKVNVVGGGVGKCVCEMKVTEDHQNRGGTLHGGLTATLVDVVSTAALLASERAVAGVSVDMNITYMKAARIGEKITIDANTLRVGKTLAFLTVDIKNEKGDLVAQGRHTKFVG